jgi:hypothetical protein
VRISAPTVTVSSSGSILANGANGGAASSSCDCGGGGGGGGGMIWLDGSVSVTVAGGLTVAGGNAGAKGSTGGAGGAGAAGRIQFTGPSITTTGETLLPANVTPNTNASASCP